MCKHIYIRKGKTGGTDTGGPTERFGSGRGRGVVGATTAGATTAENGRGTTGRQSGGSGLGRGAVGATTAGNGTGGNGRGTTGTGAGVNGGRGGGATHVRGGVTTHVRGPISSPNSTGSPSSVGSKRPAALHVDRGGGGRSKCKAILSEGSGRSGADGEASTSNGSERTTSASLSRTSIPAQYPPRTLPLELRAPTSQDTTQEVPEEEEDYEMPQYEEEEVEEDDEEEDSEEDEDAPVPEDQDFDQLLDNLLQLPGREQLVRLSVDPIPNVKSIW